MEKPGGGAASGAAAQEQASSLAAAAQLPGSFDLAAHIEQEAAAGTPKPWSNQETRAHVQQQQEEEEQQEQRAGEEEQQENPAISQLPETYKKQEFAAGPRGAVTIAGRRLATGEIPEGEVIHLKDYPPSEQREGSDEGSGQLGSQESSAHDVQEVAMSEADAREAHSIAAAAAAAAAALVHIGEPVRRAANVAEVAMDPSSTVDFDSTAGPAADHTDEPLSPTFTGGIMDSSTLPQEASTPGPLAHSAGELLAAHDSAARAAAVAGALVHLGQSVPRAANMAEAAVAPADVVDFDSARTNAPVADTVPDIIASGAAQPLELGANGQQQLGQQEQGQQQQGQQQQGQEEEEEEQGLSPILLTEESLEAAGLGIGDIEPEAVPPAAHATEPSLPMHTECEHVGGGAAPAATSKSAHTAAPTSARTAAGQHAQQPIAGAPGSSAAAAEATLPPPPPPIATKMPDSPTDGAGEPRQVLVMEQVTTLQYPEAEGEPGSSGSSREAGAAAAEAAAAAAAQAAAAAATAAAGTPQHSRPHEQDVHRSSPDADETHKTAEQRQQERIAAMADMLRHAAALGLTDAGALAEQQPQAVVEAVAVRLTEPDEAPAGSAFGSVAESGSETSRSTTPLALAAATAASPGVGEEAVAGAGSVAAAKVVSSSSQLPTDAKEILASQLPLLPEPLRRGIDIAASNGLSLFESSELPNAGMLLEQALMVTSAQREAARSPLGQLGQGASGADEDAGRSPLGRVSAGGATAGPDAAPSTAAKGGAAGAAGGGGGGLPFTAVEGGDMGSKGMEQLLGRLPELESLVAYDAAPVQPDQLPFAEAGIAKGILGAKGSSKESGGVNGGTSDMAGDRSDQGRGRQQWQEQQGPEGAAEAGQGGQEEEEEEGNLGLLVADVAVQGTAPVGSHRLRRAHEHSAHAAAAAAGLMHAGQPLREAADLAEVATNPAQFVDATAAHVRMQHRPGKSDVLSSGADFEAGDGDDGEGSGSGSSGGSSERERGGAAVNKTDLSVPIAAMASATASDEGGAGATAGAAAAAGGMQDQDAHSPADVAAHNHVAKAAAAAAALHFAGVHVATAADLAEVSTAPATVVEEDSGGGGGPDTPSRRARRHLLATGAVLTTSSGEGATEQLPEWYSADLPASGAVGGPGSSAAGASTSVAAVAAASPPSPDTPVTPHTRVLNMNSELASQLLSRKGGSRDLAAADAPAEQQQEQQQQEEEGAGERSSSSSNRSVAGSQPDATGKPLADAISVSKHQQQELQRQEEQRRLRQQQQQQQGEAAERASVASDASASSNSQEAVTPKMLQSTTFAPDLVRLAYAVEQAPDMPHTPDAPQPLENVSRQMMAQGLQHAASAHSKVPAPSSSPAPALPPLVGEVGGTQPSGFERAWGAVTGKGDAASGSSSAAGGSSLLGHATMGSSAFSSSAVGGSNVSTVGSSSAASLGELAGLAPSEVSPGDEESSDNIGGDSVRGALSPGAVTLDAASTGSRQQGGEQEGGQQLGGDAGIAGVLPVLPEPVSLVIDEPEAAAERAAVLISKGSMAAIMQDSTQAAGVAAAEAEAQSAAAALAGSTAEAVLGDEPGTQAVAGDTQPAGETLEAGPLAGGVVAAVLAAAAQLPKRRSAAAGPGMVRLESHGLFENVADRPSPIALHHVGQSTGSLASMDIPGLPQPDSDVTAAAALMPDHQAGGDYEGVHVHHRHPEGPEHQGSEHQGSEHQGSQHQGSEHQGSAHSEGAVQQGEQLHLQPGREGGYAGDPAADPLDRGSGHASIQQAAGGPVARERPQELHVMPGREQPGVGDPAAVPLGGGSHYAHTQQAAARVGLEQQQVQEGSEQRLLHA